jgi:hypothetical protein
VEAVGCFTESLKHDATISEVYNHRAQVLSSLGQHDLAKLDLRKAEEEVTRGEEEGRTFEKQWRRLFLDHLFILLPHLAHFPKWRARRRSSLVRLFVH